MSSKPDEELYESVRDFGGPSPHIKIISSDNYAFIISIKVLTNASLVFRGMIDTCANTDTTAILQLSDESEEYQTVEALLEYMTAERDFGNISDQEEHVVQLAKKYECLDILTRIELAIYREITSRPRYGYYVVGCAASLEAWPAYGQIISSLDAENKENSCLQSMVDPRNWSLECLQSNLAYRPMFIWGINRAAIEAYHPDTGMDYKRMGKIFIKIMAEAKKDKYYQPDE